MPRRPSRGRGVVFSTPVEVFLPAVAPAMPAKSLLHARGGVSIGAEQSTRMAASSPRPWRCFQFWGHALQGLSVFSTPVEVFLWLSSGLVGLLGLLHARGGVSISYCPGANRGGSSPRPWRCFSFVIPPATFILVFSTHVEVFLLHQRAGERPQRLLHARTLHTRTLSHSTPLSPSHHTLCFLLVPGINF